MPSIVDHPIFEANRLTPLDMADLMCHFLGHLFSGRMSTEQFLAFITHKLSGPGAVKCSEDEEMVFAKAMAQVYHEKYQMNSNLCSFDRTRKSGTPVECSSLTPPPDMTRSEPQKLVSAEEHEDAMQEVIMTDDAPPDDQMVPKIEGDMNDRSASCAPATERGKNSSEESRSNLAALAFEAVPVDVTPVDAEIMSTIEIDLDHIAQGDYLPDSALPNC